MKKLLVAIAFIAAAGTVQAQAVKPVVKSKSTATTTTTTARMAPQPAAAAPAKDPNGPVFSFKGGETHDFGNIPEGPSAEYEFQFTNTGKKPLIIQEANASCGCTTPEWPKEPILPGKSGNIKVKFDTKGKGNQPFNKTVFIRSNAQTDKERYELYIKGFVQGSGAPAAKDAK